MESFEKLGAFYLGRVVDPESRPRDGGSVLYDSRHLTTHAVIVGMTGSGKTGLGVALLEEAAIDGMPAIAIDPKGDLGNLLLTFPELRATRLPALDRSGRSRARRAGPDEHARRHGRALASRSRRVGPGRIAHRAPARRGATFRSTRRAAGPGAASNLLRSFAAPAASGLDDEDAIAARVQSAVSGLLALVGVDADPLRSREHVLLSTLLDRAWRDGRDMDLASWIREIQSPPLERVGVLDLESFFPAKARFELALRAEQTPRVAVVRRLAEGEPLDVGRLLWTADGRPRISILSIAHLSDAERMFFVTLLLNEVIAWMRAQPGTTSLRAILYIDEVFGYVPPTANPPTKLPLLTLLKQARAFGLGVVLATQNPVDLDYKALANAGTWFLGRLQTERDKARVLDGLEGVAAASGATFERASIDAPALRPRVARVPAARRARSGPAAVPVALGVVVPARPAHTCRDPAPDATESDRGARAACSAGLTRSVGRGGAPGPASGDRGAVPRRRKRSHEHSLGRIAPRAPGRSASALRRCQARRRPLGACGAPCAARWRRGRRVGERDGARSAARPRRRAPGRALRGAPGPGEPAEVVRRVGARALGHLTRVRTLPLFRASEARLVSRPGESEGEFRGRVAHGARESRDAELARLEQRYAPRLAALRERVHRAEGRVTREQAQLGQKRLETAISVGATVLGALFGRKAVSAGTLGRATTAARGVGRAAREQGDVEAAEREVAQQRSELETLEREVEQATAALRTGVEAGGPPLERVDLRPRRAEIEIVRVALAWCPGGSATS